MQHCRNDMHTPVCIFSWTSEKVESGTNFISLHLASVGIAWHTRWWHLGHLRRAGSILIVCSNFHSHTLWSHHAIKHMVSQLFWPCNIPPPPSTKEGSHLWMRCTICGWRYSCITTPLHKEKKIILTWSSHHYIHTLTETHSLYLPGVLFIKSDSM